MSKKYNLFHTDSKSYKPFHYPSAYDRYKTHEVALHWTTEEIDLSGDMKDWTTISIEEKHIITSIFQGFVQNDTEVGMGYDILIRAFKPNEVKMMLRSFGNRESLHQDAYSLLLDTLGFPEEFYKEYEYIPSLSLKYDYIHKARVRQFHYYVSEYGIEKADIEFRKDVARMIAVYSGLVEGISLFAQFAILASFSRDGKFPGMNKVLSWSILDENCIIEGTEVQLEDGSWKKIEDLQPGEKILQFDMETEEYSFVEPTHFTKSCPDYYYKFESDDVEQIVTPGHRMVFKRDGKAQEEIAEKYEFVEGDEFIKGGSSKIEKTKLENTDKKNFYCPTVPGKAFVIRSNGKVSVTGNCHIDGNAWLFKTIIKENRQIWNDDFKRDIYEAARQIVAKEEDYIDYVFKLGDLNNLTKDEMKLYVRYIADQRLKQFGLKPNYGIKENPLPWMENQLSLTTYTNFFESTVSEYSFGTMTGSWDEAKEKMKELFS